MRRADSAIHFAPCGGGSAVSRSTTADQRGIAACAAATVAGATTGEEGNERMRMRRDWVPHHAAADRGRRALVFPDADEELPGACAQGAW
jgi:hypothetical protein